MNDGLVVELDVFSGKNNGLVIAEVEFETQEQAELFQKPDWFGKEVTNDLAYRNSNLSKPAK
jgi:CYTH domain-containing protein